MCKVTSIKVDKVQMPLNMPEGDKQSLSPASVFNRSFAGSGLSDVSLSSQITQSHVKAGHEAASWCRLEKIVLDYLNFARPCDCERFYMEGCGRGSWNTVVKFQSKVSDEIRDKGFLEACEQGHFDVVLGLIVHVSDDVKRKAATNACVLSQEEIVVELFRRLSLVDAMQAVQGLAKRSYIGSSQRQFNKRLGTFFAEEFREVFESSKDSLESYLRFIGSCCYGIEFFQNNEDWPKDIVATGFLIAAALGHDQLAVKLSDLVKLSVLARAMRMHNVQLNAYIMGSRKERIIMVLLSEFLSIDDNDIGNHLDNVCELLDPSRVSLVRFAESCCREGELASLDGFDEIIYGLGMKLAVKHEQEITVARLHRWITPSQHIRYAEYACERGSIKAAAVLFSRLPLEEVEEILMHIVLRLRPENPEERLVQVNKLNGVGDELCKYYNQNAKQNTITFITACCTDEFAVARDCISLVQTYVLEDGFAVAFHHNSVSTVGLLAHSLPPKLLHEFFKRALEERPRNIVIAMLSCMSADRFCRVWFDCTKKYDYYSVEQRTEMMATLKELVDNLSLSQIVSILKMNSAWGVGNSQFRQVVGWCYKVASEGHFKAYFGALSSRDEIEKSFLYVCQEGITNGVKASLRFKLSREVYEEGFVHLCERGKFILCKHMMRKVTPTAINKGLGAAFDMAQHKVVELLVDSASDDFLEELFKSACMRPCLHTVRLLAGRYESNQDLLLIGVSALEERYKRSVYDRQLCLRCVRAILCHLDEFPFADEFSEESKT